MGKFEKWNAFEGFGSSKPDIRHSFVKSNFNNNLELVLRVGCLQMQVRSLKTNIFIAPYMFSLSLRFTCQVYVGYHTLHLAQNSVNEHFKMLQ